MKTKALYKLAEEENITIDNVRLPLTKAFSLMDEEGDCFVALDYSQITNDREERVMLAHELGHCVRGAFYNRYSAVDCKSRHERRADVWAYRSWSQRTSCTRRLCAAMWKFGSWRNTSTCRRT